MVGLFPHVTFADDAPPATPMGRPLQTIAKPAPIIVNGKKFFPLNNVRRFTASGPSALQVMHHPRSTATIVGNHSTLSPMGVNGGDAGVKTISGAETPPFAPSVAQGAHPAQPSDVLSIFTPEDKSAPAFPAAQATTK